MEVIYSYTGSYLSNEPKACALGFFDGVHVGHLRLISTLKQISQSMKMKSMIFTFEKHPLSLLNKENIPKLITDNDSKSCMFNELGIDIVNYANVNMSFLNTEPQDFLKNILIKEYNVKALVVGFNFRFGSGGKGNSDMIIDFGIKNNINVSIVEPFTVDGMIVSSTIIRDLLLSGDIITANKMLGRRFSLQGKVMHGKKRGTDLGFPTANIYIGPHLIVPKNGVYITKVIIDNVERIGVTNIGYNPTFGNSTISVETHIVDFNCDIYDRQIKIEFVGRIRDEITFENFSELSAQIHSDKQMAIQLSK